MIVWRVGTAQEAPLLHPTREQLAWQSAIHGVRARARFYSAIRRKLDGGESTREPAIEAHEMFQSPEISPKSTDSLLLDQ